MAMGGVDANLGIESEIGVDAEIKSGLKIPLLERAEPHPCMDCPSD